MEKAGGDIEKALEQVAGGKDKSKNFIELAKRNIDLDFAAENRKEGGEEIGGHLPIKILSTAGNGTSGFKKSGENKKKKRVFDMDLYEDE